MARYEVRVQIGDVELGIGALRDGEPLASFEDEAEADAFATAEGSGQHLGVGIVDGLQSVIDWGTHPDGDPWYTDFHGERCEMDGSPWIDDAE